MKFRTCHSFLVLLFSIQMPVISFAGDGFVPPAKYIQAKLQQNDIVFLGTTHQNPRSLKFIAELIPTLEKYGVTHIGLKIPSDQQGQIDHFMKTGDGLENLQFHFQVNHPDYRNLFFVLRKADGPKPVAIDLPYSKFDEDISRVEWMASKLLELHDPEPPIKIMVVVGSLHIFKKLAWQEHVPNKHLSIGQYIQRKNQIYGCGLWVN